MKLLLRLIGASWVASVVLVATSMSRMAEATPVDESAKASESSKSSVSYGLMIDAGTGGTRIYPFYWQTITRNNLYVQVNPVLKKSGKKPQKAKVTPGLALKSPNEVAAYLQPLIDKAKEFIPQDQHANTPILFKATAGMRLLPVSRRNEVMRAVIAFLNDRSQVPFRFNAANGAQIISGEQEGVYGWVTTNAMMGTLRGSNAQQVTFANIDLGRGSTQITFKPPVVPLENAYITRVNGTEYELYSHSYLRMGLEEARSRVIASLAGNNNNKVDDPCLFRGTVQNYSLNDRTVQLVGQGQFDKCRDLARQVLLGRNTFCATEPCAINGVHQPDIPDGMPIYATGNYFDIADALKCAGKSSMNCIAQSAQGFCSGSEGNVKKDKAKSTSDDDEDGETDNTTCFGAALSLALTVDSYRISLDREVNFVDEIPAGKFSWGLGAMIDTIENIGLSIATKPSA